MIITSGRGSIPARRTLAALVALVALLRPSPVAAHPLGNFSINRWAAVRPGDRVITIDYAVDFAEIPTFQESPAIDADGDGRETGAEIRAFAAARAAALETGLAVEIDGIGMPLGIVSSGLEFAPGAGGLRTMKLTARYEGSLPRPVPEAGARVSFRDRNFEGRAGWREMIACGSESAAVVDSSVPAEDRSRALSSYPADLIQAPPQDVRAEFRLLTGAAASGARRAGIARTAPSDPSATAEARPPFGDGLTRLIGPASAGFGIGVLLAAFAGALFWGGAHALSPGHGKTIVAAYLVGRRGAPLHAVWLGLIVTFTHTIGVFALGALTLVLSRRFVPESLYPWLGFASGLTVTAMGAGLLWRRLRPHAHDAEAAHSHGPGGHTHADPETLSLRGLLALGIAGGIVPCPSALVVLLSAIAFRRVLFGMALIVAFSAGLAAVLIGVGLLMVYARGLFERFDAHGRLGERLGTVSAATILVLGIGIAAKSLPLSCAAPLARATPTGLWATLSILGLGLLFGLKHATEADHLAAVGSIVSEGGGLLRAIRTGGLWGAGHTLSIVVAGLFVLGLHLAIPETVARRLELAVALMIVGLGSAALVRALNMKTSGATHRHAHATHRHEHAVTIPLGLKPLLVGMMHGLAGSAALTLLVLAQIRSVTLGMIYLLVFGAGSVGGMALMSLVIGLPFRATAGRPTINRGIRVGAGILSIAFGLFYAWTQVTA